MTETENKIEAEALSNRSLNNSKFTKLGFYSTLLSLLLITIIIVAGFWLYQQNQAVMNQQQQQLSTLSEKLTLQSSQQTAQLRQSVKMKTDLEAQIERVTLQLQHANNDSQIAKTDIQALQRSFAETNVRHPNDWILAEVEYLVTLAGRKIWLEKDIQTAIALLVAADQRVVELNDASLSALRGALLEDINSLEVLPKQDNDGAILALAGLERRVNNLLANSLVMPNAAENSKTDVSTDINEWDTNLLKSWQIFVESFVTVNTRDSKIEALLAPEQTWYLREYLRNSIAKAEFAIYREQQEIYDIAIQSSLKVLENYYDLNNSINGNFYKSLQRLSKRKISINYPDQLESAPLLEKILDQRIQKSLASSSLK